MRAARGRPRTAAVTLKNLCCELADSVDDLLWLLVAAGMISFVPAAVGAAADEKKAKRKALMKVQRWVEDALPEEYEAWVVMASELRCYVPGCAPLETSVSLLDPVSSSAAPGGSRAFKVFKPAVEVEKDEALAALAQALSGGANPEHLAEDPLGPLKDIGLGDGVKRQRTSDEATGEGEGGASGSAEHVATNASPASVIAAAPPAAAATGVGCEPSEILAPPG